jgi:hypothetical protein
MSPYSGGPTLTVLPSSPPLKNAPYNPTWPKRKGITRAGKTFYGPRPRKNKEIKNNEKEQEVTRPRSQPPMALQWLPNYPHNLIKKLHGHNTWTLMLFLLLPLIIQEFDQ